jgi:hypothetical protein
MSKPASDGKSTERLDRIVLELGTEVYRMKHEISAMQQTQEKLLNIIVQFKKIMEESDLVDRQAIDETLDFDTLQSNISDLEYIYDESLTITKKISH